LTVVARPFDRDLRVGKGRDVFAQGDRRHSLELSTGT
jgi:hypothetical protein